MLDTISQGGAWLLLGIALMQVLNARPKHVTWIFLFSIAGLLTFFDIATMTQRLLKIDSLLPIGMMGFMGVALIGLLVRYRVQARWRPYQLMTLIALMGWLIAHSAFWAGEKHWLEPRYNALQSQQYAWLNQLPLPEQLRLCQRAELGCEKSNNAIRIKQQIRVQRRNQIMAPALDLLSAGASTCYSLGLMLLMLGHRRKRHV